MNNIKLAKQSVEFHNGYNEGLDHGYCDHGNGYEYTDHNMGPDASDYFKGYYAGYEAGWAQSVRICENIAKL
jgi:hypothetical protein